MQCKSGDVMNHASEDLNAVDSDVDDDDDDVTDSRPAATAGTGGCGGGPGGVEDREVTDIKLDEDRDLLSSRHHARDVDATQCDIIRRRKRAAGDHVTSDHVTLSPPGDDDEDDEFGELRPGSSSRGEPVSDEGACSQTEIKIQRPLGLLAQHGITTKASAAALRTSSHHSLYKADVMESTKDRPSLSVGQHHPQSLTGLDFSSASLSLMDRRFMPSPPAASTPLSCLEHGKTSATSPGAHHWTFEEQFKQVSSLYIVISVIASHRPALDELSAAQSCTVRPVKAKFHYASWFGAGSEPAPNKLA